jgi:hypothetical protein
MFDILERGSDGTRTDPLQITVFEGPAAAQAVSG